MKMQLKAKSSGTQRVLLCQLQRTKRIQKIAKASTKAAPVLKPRRPWNSWNFLTLTSQSLCSISPWWNRPPAWFFFQEGHLKILVVHPKANIVRLEISTEFVIGKRDTNDLHHHEQTPESQPSHSSTNSQKNVIHKAENEEPIRNWDSRSQSANQSHQSAPPKAADATPKVPPYSAKWQMKWMRFCRLGPQSSSRTQTQVGFCNVSVQWKYAALTWRHRCLHDARHFSWPRVFQSVLNQNLVVWVELQDCHHGWSCDPFPVSRPGQQREEIDQDISSWPLPLFFCLNAAWLNEGRCPGGRPSVSVNKVKSRKFIGNQFPWKLQSQNQKRKNTNLNAVSRRVQAGIGVACSPTVRSTASWLRREHVNRRGRRCLLHGLEDAAYFEK